MKIVVLPSEGGSPQKCPTGVAMAQGEGEAGLQLGDEGSYTMHTQGRQLRSPRCLFPWPPKSVFSLKEGPFYSQVEGREA